MKLDIADRQCSNYIFILNLTPGFNGLSEENCTRIQEKFKLWDLVRLILEVLRYMLSPVSMPLPAVSHIASNIFYIIWLRYNNQGILTHWCLGNMTCYFNSLTPGKFEWNFRYLILQIILVIDGWGICCELALRWMSLDLTDGKSRLVQVMAWCHQVTSHYPSQYWPRSLLPYGLTGPQWVKKIILIWNTVS